MKRMEVLLDTLCEAIWEKDTHIDLLQGALAAAERERDQYKRLYEEFEKAADKEALA